MENSPLTHMLAGRQGMVMASADRLMAFALPEQPSKPGPKSVERQGADEQKQGDVNFTRCSEMQQVFEKRCEIYRPNSI